MMRSFSWVDGAMQAPELPAFEGHRVLVVGDVMLDRYWTGETGRVSPEAPVPVVRVSGDDARPGGAGNVAVNLAAMGAEVTLIGVVGADPAGEELEELLEAVPGVTPVLVEDPTGTTITKLRVLSRHQQLIRLDFEADEPGLDGWRLAGVFQEHLADADVVVLSDYAKGSLVDPAGVIDQARRADVPVLVDPKGKDFARYRGATVLTPNLAEFEAVAGPCADEATLYERARGLVEQHGLGALLITRGDHGMTLVGLGQDAPVNIPAQAREVFDVTGAGDTVVAGLAAGVAAGMALEAAARLANVCAGVAVGKVGAATVTMPELRRALDQLNGNHRGVVDEAALLTAVADARAHGERVVMTNGCFDLLHAGHVRHLQQARQLGDRLIVAVNDDASVGRLKGPDRPVMGLDDRLAVLAGLDAVDWVVAFGEDTPERLICRVRPDVLVKGGDYRPEDIAGAACAGQVKVLDYHSGQSTTWLISSIRDNGAN